MINEINELIEKVKLHGYNPEKGRKYIIPSNRNNIHQKLILWYSKIFVKFGNKYAYCICFK